MRVTDGPNGARGSSILGAGEATAVCIPCGSALGATWNPELIERLGALLGEEALTKGCRVLLAPTLNLHRSPLAGRNFECFSEDPLLAGRAAAAYVRGVQSRDVATTLKHFAGNEAELDRYTMSSVIDERTLRELYLVPFELAVREGGALGIMTAYNRLNGGYCTEDERLLAGILRGEWGFEGFVVSDWFGLASTDGVAARRARPRDARARAASTAPRWPTPCARARSTRRCVDAQVRRLLGVLDRVGALDDDPEAPERSEDRPEHRALGARGRRRQLRAAAQRGPAAARPGRPALARRASGPTPTARRSWAAARPSCARTTRSRRWQALRERLPGVDMRHERGCDIDRTRARAARRAGGSRSRARTTWPSATRGCCCSTPRSARADAAATPRGRELTPAETGRAHVHAAPGRARTAAGRRRGRARRLRGPAAARRGDDRPGQRGDRRPRWR